MKTIPITIRPEYLAMIRSKAKCLEIRVGYPNIRSIQPNDHIRFMSGTDRQIAKVENIRKYDTFEEMITREDYRKIIPGLTKEEVLMALRGIYPPAKESLGVIVIEVYPVFFEVNNI